MEDKEFEKILAMDAEIDKMYIESLERDLYRAECKIVELELMLKLNLHGGKN